MSMLLVITGVLTAGAAVGLVAPKQVLALLFGTMHPDDAMVLVTRHWGLLVASIGVMLVYAGYHADVRVPVMIVGVVEKLAIAALILASPFRTRPLAIAIAGADSAMAVALLVALLSR